MKARRTQKKRKLDDLDAKAKPSERRVSGPVESRSRAQTWVFRLVGLTLIPLLALGLIELGLRVGGFGYSTAFFKPAAIGGEAVLVENDQFGLRFFPPSLLRIPAPIVMKAAKPPRSIRIFVLGESAALGDPRPNYSAARYMEALLRERFPGTHFEILNTSMTAINSHVIVPIARECARYQGDFWIIYMGNNEMVGPYGAASVTGPRAPPRGLIRASLALQRLRAGQLLMACSRRLLKGSGNTPGWKGMEMFLQNEVPPEGPQKEMVYRNFRRNLDDILSAGIDAGTRIILNTVAVNLKDCPPFASSRAGNTDQNQAADKLNAEGSVVLKSGDFVKAKKIYEEAAGQFQDAADMQFGLAQSCLGLGETAAAQQHFQRAVDLDALPFRADSRINGAIREAAGRLASTNLELCDAASIFGSNGPSHIPGQESFYEHVHFNFDGNFILGLAWAREIERLLPAEVRQSASTNWASQEICERRLGLTDWNRLSTIEEVLQRLSRPPFSRQQNGVLRIQQFQGRLDELTLRSSTAEAKSSAKRLYMEALARDPDDFCLHENFAEFLEAIGDLPQTASEWAKARDLIPHYYLPYYNLGVALDRQGTLVQARDALLKAASLNPNNGDIRVEIGMTYARQGAWQTALEQFVQARQLDPGNPRQLLYSGEMLWKLNRRAESMQALRDAIRLQPDYWQAHYRLADELALSGQNEAAAAEFRETLRVNPSYVKAHENLGVALYKLGRNDEAVREFDETLRLDPQNRTASGFKRQAQEYRPRK